MLLAKESAEARAFVTEGQRALARSDRGAAVLAFERARWLAPRAAPVRSAIAAAGVQDAEPIFPRALRWVTAREWYALATACGWISGLGIVWLVARRRSRSAVWVALAAGGAFVLGMTAIMETNVSAPAVVTGTDVHLLVAPYSEAAEEKPLPVGTMVTVGSKHNDFIHVEDSEGAEGWVKRSNVECVARSDS
jgi:hypothetical protein